MKSITFFGKYYAFAEMGLRWKSNTCYWPSEAKNAPRWTLIVWYPRL